MSGLILHEFLDKLTSFNSSNATWFGSSLELRLVTADAKRRQVVYEYEVTEDEIFRGYLDSGWLSTVVDNATDPLICAVANNTNTFTTSLTVHTLEPILPGTRLEIVCKLVQFQGRLLQSSAVFRDARKPGLVYATGMHTMLYKETVGNVAAKL
ncbi:hypothetical protein GQ54DRAFT_198063 [Martensiomyces pterosporus]|nr:hypothetical protein GQ54DRAFT_198063 [Martensiomyces pterosporus]